MRNLPKSSTLFHFTPRYEYLLGILKDGFQPRYCLEYFPWYGSTYFASFAMTCFCEIPLTKINPHISRYGQYGLGMSREWAVKNNLSPLAYCPDSQSESSVAINNLLQGINTVSETAERNNLKASLSNLLRFYKPIRGPQLTKDDSGDTRMEEGHDYSHECEWRYMPEFENNMLGRSIKIAENTWDLKDVGELDLEVKKRNESNTHNPLQFDAGDVNYIFVPTKDDIPKAHWDVIKCNSNFTRNERIILSTKITALDTMFGDL